MAERREARAWRLSLVPTLNGFHLRLALMAIPLMIASTFAGRYFTGLIGESGYARLFWLVIGGYTMRLAFQFV